LKIEGRMKSIFYVGGVVRVYRAALDYLRGLPPAGWRDPGAIEMPGIFMEEIVKTGTRGATENFIRKRPGNKEMLYYTSRAEQPVEPVAVIREAGDPLLVEVRNVLTTGEHIEYMTPGIDVVPVMIKAMHDQKRQPVPRANPGNLVYLTTMPLLSGAEKHGILRRPRMDIKSDSSPDSHRGKN
jgi:U32 family peptidase